MENERVTNWILFVGWGRIQSLIYTSCSIPRNVWQDLSNWRTPRINKKIPPINWHKFGVNELNIVKNTCAHMYWENGVAMLDDAGERWVVVVERRLEEMYYVKSYMTIYMKGYNDRLGFLPLYGPILMLSKITSFYWN